MQVFGANELLSDVVEKNLCIGCGACVSLCPYYRAHRGRVVMLFGCTQQGGRCFAYCPKVEVNLDEVSDALFSSPYNDAPLGTYRSIQVSRAGDKLGRTNVQSGGTVSAVITYAIRSHMIDAAVLTDRDGMLPVPRIVTKAKDVLKCASSKYTAAPTLMALNQAVGEGYARLGVVATPCQALAIAQMRMNPTKIENFTDPTAVVIGLFCTWSVEYKELEAFLAERLDINAIMKFDIPPPPAEVLDVYTTAGKVSFPLSEIRLRVPDTCSYCFDMTSEFADISVGVLEDRPDTNIVIIRTERGERLLSGAVKRGYLVLEDIPGASLDHLMEAAGNKKRRALIRAGEEGMINTQGESKRSYLRLGEDVLGKITCRGGGAA